MEKMLSEAAALPAVPWEIQAMRPLAQDHMWPQQYTEHVCSSEERRGLPPARQPR